MVEMEPGSGGAGKGSNCGWTMRRTHVDQKTGSFFFDHHSDFHKFFGFNFNFNKFQWIMIFQNSCKVNVSAKLVIWKTVQLVDKWI